MNKWLCPECGTTGVCEGYTPKCHICSFKIDMIKISDRLYNKYHAALWAQMEVRIWFKNRNLTFEDLYK